MNDRLSLPRTLACLSLASLGLMVGLAGACGGKAADAGGDGDRAPGGDGDGDGPVPGDGDSSGDGDGDGFDRSCSTTAECDLVGSSCCGSCGPQTLTDFTSIRVGQRAAYMDALCPEDYGCPDCASFANPNLYASCRGGACVAVDLTTEPASECATADECVILPDACCECGAGTDIEQVVAININGAQDFRASQCASVEPIACPECEWERPGDLVADCISGRCRVVLSVLDQTGDDDGE